MYAGLLTLAAMLGGCGGGSGGGVTSALIQTLPVDDDLKDAIQQVVDDEADEVDVATLVGNRISYRAGLSRLDASLGSPESPPGDAALDGGFLALASNADAGVAQVGLSPSSSVSLILGASRAGEDLAAIDYDYAPVDGLALGLRAGAMRERSGVFGNNTTRFIEGRFTKRIARDVAMIGEIGIGRTQATGTAGMLGIDGALTSVETRLGLALSNLGRAGDRLTLSGGVPMHVADGAATVRGTAAEIALGGGDIPIEMRLDYALPLGEGLTVGLNGGIGRNAAKETDGDLALGLKLAF